MLIASKSLLEKPRLAESVSGFSYVVIESFCFSLQRQSQQWFVCSC
uniref:Uncharacterized protein n=1 Tax=Aegilops tauschii subsp. strangulata TaxID=200361 RepID=A0A453RTI4_AEGTS